MTLLSAACASEQLTTTPTASTLDMSGRWVLDAPNAPSCGMVFESAADGMQGTVTPDGGCPGKLYRSKLWQLAQGQLTLNDSDRQPLAQLAFSGGQFKGRSGDGLAITLRP